MTHHDYGWTKLSGVKSTPGDLVRLIERQIIQSYRDVADYLGLAEAAKRYQDQLDALLAERGEKLEQKDKEAEQP